MNDISIFPKTFVINQQYILLRHCEVYLMLSIITSSTSWPGKHRISVLEKDKSDKGEDLNKDDSGWEE